MVVDLRNRSEICRSRALEGVPGSVRAWNIYVRRDDARRCSVRRFHWFPQQKEAHLPELLVGILVSGSQFILPIVLPS